jgi:hypothetical protein
VAKFEEGVLKHGAHRPSLVAAVVGSRSAEQVRERIRWQKKKAVAAAAAEAAEAAAAAAAAAAAGPLLAPPEE